jgi:hypothetical protein
MKASFLLLAGLAAAVLSIALLLCGLSSTAMSQTATPSGGAATSLPDVVVEAPKQVARPQKPKQHAVARSTVSPSTTSTPSASPMSQAAQLAKLEKATGSCAGGCVTSFRSGNAPWRGCSVTSWPLLSSTCRNVGNYKNYAECEEAGLVTGWRANEVGWYCSSLALK